MHFYYKNLGKLNDGISMAGSSAEYFHNYGFQPGGYLGVATDSVFNFPWCSLGSPIQALGPKQASALNLAKELFSWQLLICAR